jgi:hypothetical protein
MLGLALKPFSIEEIQMLITKYDIILSPSVIKATSQVDSLIIDSIKLAF